MASHLSSIGFLVSSAEELLALARQHADAIDVVEVQDGGYLRLRGAGGEELWLQVDDDGGLFGYNPHFSGSSRVRVGLVERVSRGSRSTVFDGGFRAWADPGDTFDDGAYPLVFDTPDAATYADLPIPTVATAQIAAFAHTLRAFDSIDAFNAYQEGRPAMLASRSFIPSGLFSPEGEKRDPPDAMGIIAGHVLQAAERSNPLTGAPYYWALVETFGGTFDLVADPSIAERMPVANDIVQGTFWLSGRLIEP